MTHKGLTTTEAKALFQQYGPNKISDGRKFNMAGKFFRELFSLLNALLIAAAVVSYFVGDATDAVLILLIVVLNTTVSVWQEFKAEKTLEELKKLNNTLVRTLRDGSEVLISSELLVPGDIIHLETGDKIPADGIILDSYNFEVNESALTGESVAVYKKAGEPDHNNVFSGTLASSGRATVKIIGTGLNTRFGRIAQTLKTIEETDTPLQKQIKDLALKLGALAVVASFLIYVVGINFGHDKITMFLTGVSTAVAMVPEGLPSIILITLAIGVKRMAAQRAVVRKMVSIEGLGSINVICTDKTGTLTQGKMTVSKIWYDGKTLTSAEFKPLIKHKYAKKMVDAMLFVNTASLAYKIDHGSVDVLGDPTEGALLLLGRDLGYNPDIYKNEKLIVDEFSFDQNLKTMSTVINQDGKFTGLIKGSPERLVANATHMVRGGEAVLLRDLDKQKLIQAYRDLAAKGLRVLGFGFKHLPETKHFDRSEVESEIIFLGFMGLADPPRPEARDAILKAHQAGIRTVMITGDNELTAMSIAQELGLATLGDEVILGKDLEKFSDEQLAQLIQRVKVFARTNPEDKLRIVKAFQALGQIVAVTGDGVNDALALKQAEIGIAMGKKGTDVAKEAADIVITDDNYATIVKAVEEGRSIFDNVLKSIRYLISTNLAEVLTIILALILGLPSPLLPVQILWINLVSDGLPAIALALDPKDPNAMSRMPRAKNKKLLDSKSLGLLFGIGITVAFLSFVAFWWHMENSGNLTLARSWVFTVLILLQMIVAFIIHGRKTPNNKLIMAVVLTLVIQGVILSVPSLHPIFKIQNLW
jgi:P-type Ca2+ transporter type 2C